MTAFSYLARTLESSQKDYQSTIVIDQTARRPFVSVNISQKRLVHCQRKVINVNVEMKRDNCG